DQRHHAVARVDVLVVTRFGAGEPRADGLERVEDLADGDVLAMPGGLDPRFDGRAHGRCHSLPSAWSSLAAEGGPQVPAGYVSRGGLLLRHDSSIGSISCQAASTSSARVNRVGSPIMQSSSNLS